MPPLSRGLPRPVHPAGGSVVFPARAGSLFGVGTDVVALTYILGFAHVIEHL